MPKLRGFSPVEIRGPRAPLGPVPKVLGFFADPIGTMVMLEREFGPLAAVADRSPALVCGFGPALNREVLGNGAVFQHDDGLPIPTPEGSALERFHRSVIFVNGETHRRYRRLLMPAFSKASLESYATDMIAMTEHALARWPVGETVDVLPLLRELTANVALRCLFGVDPRKGGRETELAELEARMLAALTSPLSMILPRAIPGTPYHSLVHAAERMRAYLLELIDRKRAQHERGGEPLRDALALMIQAQDDDGSQLSDDELIGNAHTLFVAGHDTSAHTLAWTLLLLERHPEILAALVDECEAELGGAPPRLEQLDRLVVLDRVLKESMRLIPATPMLFIRVCASETRLRDVALPAQANVVLSPYVTHRDPERYGEPMRFRPQRWEQLSPTPYEYLPFGAGPRTCLGIGFASQLLRLVLPMIIQRFGFSLAAGARVDRKVRGIVTAPKQGLPMRLRRQDREFRRGGPIRGDIHEMVALN